MYYFITNVMQDIKKTTLKTDKKNSDICICISTTKQVESKVPQYEVQGAEQTFATPLTHYKITT